MGVTEVSSLYFLIGKGDEEDPGPDLAVLALCDHLILTYGSYGVMAAFFNGGEQSCFF